MSEHPATAQAETIAFLMQPQSYGAGNGVVERIDTHGAMVFLVGDCAYKLKRAVKLPYFDFSTPDKRHAVVERELALNRRTAPELYLGVEPIRRGTDGGLHLGGEGEAVDWLVVMRRFPEAAVLDRLSAAGRLDPALMPRLAQRIRQFHEDAARTADAPWLASLAHIIDTLEETLLRERAGALAPTAADYLRRLRQELHERTPLLRQRQADGFVRHCHGDLHLKNIVLQDDEPVLFDALEFDENLATIDVLYDLAFLLMDLWHRGARQEANTVLGAYFQSSGHEREWAGLALLPLFLSLRAAIRTMVSVDSLAVVPDDARAGTEQAVRDYMALAVELLVPRAPMLVCVGGLSGTGKTTVARALAPAIGAVPGAIHLRSDVERKMMFGLEPLSHLPAEAYHPEVGERLYRRLCDQASAILRAGHAVILDAGFREAGQRDAAAALAAAAGVPFRALWLQADPERLLARVSSAQRDASDAGPDVVKRQLQSAAVSLPDGWQPVDANAGIEQTIACASGAPALNGPWRKNHPAHADPQPKIESWGNPGWPLMQSDRLHRAFSYYLGLRREKRPC